MALFSKTKTASDILKLIAELPEDERQSLLATLANEGEEEAAEETDTEATEATEEAAEIEAEGNEETTEESTEESTEEDPAAEGEESLPEEAEAEAEAVEAEAVPENTEEAAEEANAEQARDFGAEIAKLTEAIAALSNRMDALDAKKAESDDEEEIGQAFGPDITNPEKPADDELEKARREAFGF